jgi:hypothetical protein
MQRLHRISEGVRFSALSGIRSEKIVGFYPGIIKLERHIRVTKQPQNGAMTASTDAPAAGSYSWQTPTASEYRQIADRFLDHCGTDQVANATLTSLAGYLYAVAVEMELHAALSLTEKR